ncbi:hypothetical protein BV96_01244 [Sphingomonas paucimobilis]|nr:hypothetical protein BV96_01244 [Sphingomonas paucimobilis]
MADQQISRTWLMNWRVDVALYLDWLRYPSYRNGKQLLLEAREKEPSLNSGSRPKRFDMCTIQGSQALPALQTNGTSRRPLTSPQAQFASAATAGERPFEAMVEGDACHGPNVPDIGAPARSEVLRQTTGAPAHSQPGGACRFRTWTKGLRGCAASASPPPLQLPGTRRRKEDAAAAVGRQPERSASYCAPAGTGQPRCLYRKLMST